MNDLKTKQTQKISEKAINFEQRDFFGSRFRCLLLTHLPKHSFYELLGKVCQNSQLTVSFDSETDAFLPKGFCDSEEPYLTNITDPIISRVLPEETQVNLLKWWIAIKPYRYIRTPVWDIVSTCTIDGKRGLLLVEAKAHSAENSPSPKELRADTNIPNHENIKNKISDANAALKELTGLSWDIDRDKYYQLSNRFAWSWKLAQLGIPVVMLYLGFIKANDMENKGCKTFQKLDDFNEHFFQKPIADIVPPRAWDKAWYVKNETDESITTELLPLIRTVKVDTCAGLD